MYMSNILVHSFLWGHWWAFTELWLSTHWASKKRILSICLAVANHLLRFCWDFAEIMLRFCWNFWQFLLSIFCSVICNSVTSKILFIPWTPFLLKMHKSKYGKPTHHLSNYNGTVKHAKAAKKLFLTTRATAVTATAGGGQFSMIYLENIGIWTLR